MDRREFKDFTAATPVERATQRLQTWLADVSSSPSFRLSSPSSSSSAETLDTSETSRRKSDRALWDERSRAVLARRFQLSGRSYAAVFYAPTDSIVRGDETEAESATAAEGSVNNSTVSSTVFDRAADFPASPFAQDFERWFGVRRFWRICAFSDSADLSQGDQSGAEMAEMAAAEALLRSEREVSPAEAQTLLSCVVMALAGAADQQGATTSAAGRDGKPLVDVPVLVNVFEPDSGTAFGYAFVRPASGGSGPGNEELPQEPRMLRFDSDSLQAAPRGYAQLTNIYDRFQDLLASHDGAPAARTVVSLAAQFSTLRTVAELLASQSRLTRSNRSRSSRSPRRLSSASPSTSGSSSSGSDASDTSDDEASVVPPLTVAEALCANSYASFRHLFRDSTDGLTLANQFFYSKFAPHVSMPMFLPNETKVCRLVLVPDGDDGRRELLQSGNNSSNSNNSAPLMSATLYRLYATVQKARKFASLSEILGPEEEPEGDPDAAGARSEFGGAAAGVVAMLTDDETAVRVALDESFATSDDLDDLDDLDAIRSPPRAHDLFGGVPEMLCAAPPQSTLARVVMRAVLGESPERSTLRALAKLWREVTRRLRFHWEGGIPLKFEPQAGRDAKMPVDHGCCMIQQHTEFLQICILDRNRIRLREKRRDAEFEFDVSAARKEPFGSETQTHNPSVPLWVPVTQR
jgi:hypothetical protein